MPGDAVWAECRGKPCQGSWVRGLVAPVDQQGEGEAALLEQVLGVDLLVGDALGRVRGSAQVAWQQPGVLHARGGDGQADQVRIASPAHFGEPVEVVLYADLDEFWQLLGQPEQVEDGIRMWLPMSSPSAPSPVIAQSSKAILPMGRRMTLLTHMSSDTEREVVAPSGPAARCGGQPSGASPLAAPARTLQLLAETCVLVDLELTPPVVPVPRVG